MIRMIVELSCDQDGCDAAYAPTTDDQLTSVQATRVGALIAGWTQSGRDDGRRDYCPDHRREDRVEQIRALAGKRLTDRQIGQRLGLTGPRVQQVRAQHGIPAGQGRVGRPRGGY